MDELDELPLQTYERVTGQKWPGGKSPMVRLMLAITTCSRALWMPFDLTR